MNRNRAAGFTLVELSIALVISSLVLLALTGVVNTSLNAWETIRAETDLRRSMRLSMQRMVTAVERSQRILVPKHDDPGTLWVESNHNVLAVTLDPRLDRNFDGKADADNDGDGKVDEDVGGDNTNDNAPGIYLIDDDNDLLVDVPGVFVRDDDEDGTPSINKSDDDVLDGIDNDEDGTIDEDLGADMNGDGAPGILGVNDDGDGSTDEGSVDDDDEDGSVDEDWFDPVVFHIVSGNLVERMPNVNGIDGRAFTETVLFPGISAFQVERVESPQAKIPMVRITLTGSLSGGGTQTIQRTVRLGSRLIEDD